MMEPDERFSAWLQRLEKALQTYNANELQHENNELQLIKHLSSIIAAEEDGAVPEWANQLNTSFQEVVGSNQNELKNSLCRLSFPKLSLIYEPLKTEVSSLSASATSLQYEPLVVGSINEKHVEEYFKHINSKSIDPVVGLCKLADYSRRVHRTTNIDNQIIDKLISKEKLKYETSSVDEALRLEKLNYLEGKDDGQFIKSSTNFLTGELHTQKVALTEAMKQEEIARLAYEAAMKKTKSFQCNVNKLENVLTTIDVQSETTKRINEIQLLIDKYNIDSAKRRLDLLGTMRTDLLTTQQCFFDRCFRTEFPSLLNHVMGIFNALTQPEKISVNSVGKDSNSLGASVTVLYAVRIGLEAMKVFRSMKEGVIHELLDDNLNRFESYLRELKALSIAPVEVSVNPRFKLDNCTVVLNFTHLYHDTPEDHVEAQSRINTSLKLMERQFSHNEFASDNQRAISFLNCNDIIGPPLWCLPIVHSPQYLHRLWNFSTEAKTDDLYVPLEFDTEWETDYDDDSESSSDSSEGENSYDRAKEFELDENIVQKLGAEACSKLTKIFRQDKFEKKMSKFVNGKRQDTVLRKRRRSRVSSANTNNSSSVDSLKRVVTPYGRGVIIENENDSDHVKVKFDWGAIGYMNKNCVNRDTEGADKINSSQYDKERDNRDNERFIFTNLRLHKLVTRILSHVKVQRAVLENVGVKDAHLSLWLHGRTSRGLSQSIEKCVIDWLRTYDIEKLKALLDEFDAKSSNDAEECNQFMNRLSAIKCPNPSLNRVALFNENEFVDFAALRVEAFEYSKKRLLNKSGQPRATHPRKNRANKSPNAEGGRVEIKTEHKIDANQTLIQNNDATERRKIVRRRRTISNEPELVFSPQMQQNLRNLVLRVMNTVNITQTIIASELFKLYQYKTSQSAVSAWFRFRASKDSERDLGKYFTKWVIRFRKVLSPSEQEKLEEIIGYINSKLNRPIDTPNPAAPNPITQNVSTLSSELTSLPSHTLLEGLGASTDVEMTTTEAINDETERLIETERLVTDMEEDANIDNVAMEELVEDEPTEVARNLKAVSEQQPEEIRNDEMDLESVSDSVKQDDKEEIESENESESESIELQAMWEKLVGEINRRNISQTFVAKEAKGISTHITQQELSFFIVHKVIPYSQRNRDFPSKLTRWLNFSQAQKELSNKLGDNTKATRKRKRFEDTIVDDHVQNLENGSDVILDKPHCDNMSKYPFCELCKEEDDLIPCSSCPCQYHSSCIEDDIAGEIAEWHCSNCEESGAANANVLAPDEKQNYCKAIGAILYFFSSKQHAWIKATIVAAHPSLETVFLVKCLPNEEEEESDEKYQWIDCSKLRLLTPNTSTMNEKDRDDEDMEDEVQDNFVRVNNRSKRFRKSSPPLEDMQESNKRRGRPPNRRESDPTTNISTTNANIGEGMSDTYLGANSLKAALCAAGTSCRAVDIVMSSTNTNVFCAIRPPGHHAGRNGCTIGCNSTGFCLLNNAAIAVTYARVRWGIEKIAVVDIDVHFGNGTAEILQYDPDTFFASVHMIYGEKNDGHCDLIRGKEFGFYPANQGATKITDNYVSVGVFPPQADSSDSKRSKTQIQNEDDEGSADSSSSDISSVDGDEFMQTDEINTSTKNSFIGSKGYLRAIANVILPKMEAFAPQLLIISAGFDGYFSDPLGGELNLSIDDYLSCTKMLMDSMNRIASRSNNPQGGRIISLLEGGYDTSSASLGLARCVAAHVSALRQKSNS